MTASRSSKASWIASLPDSERTRAIRELDPREAIELVYCWALWARPEQLPPSGDWQTWLVKAGRGFGKTRTGAEWIRWLVETDQARSVAVVAPTAADARDVMVEGESGILAVCPPRNRPKYEPSRRRLTWPNGAVGITYSAEEPERLRGPQHDAAWCDEVGSWKKPDTWSNLLFGLRKGANPRACVTFTPRQTTLIRSLIDSPTSVLTGGSTYENRANLAPQFFENVVAAYEGTRLGLQEIHAHLLEIIEGAWFPSYDPRQVESESAEYLPGVPVCLAIDCGVSGHTGAVFLQVRRLERYRVAVNVFGDYYASGLYSAANAAAIMAKAVELCEGRLDRVRLDPAASAKTGVGPAAYGEYEQVFGSRALSYWPRHLVADGLDLIEVMLGSESRAPELTIHPRCKHLIEAFKNYQHDFRGGEWQAFPKDPDHPHEDLMDALRGGLYDAFPDGRKPDPKFRMVDARQVF